jgi:hypothetical protein
LRERHDGWTQAKRAAFLAALEETGCVRAACSVVKLSSTSAYRHRRRSASFARDWETALVRAKANVEAMAYERLMTGSRRVRMKDGKELWTEYRQSDSLLALLLKARLLESPAPLGTRAGGTGDAGGGAAGGGVGRPRARREVVEAGWPYPRGGTVIDADGFVTVTVRMLPEEADWYLSEEYAREAVSPDYLEWAAIGEQRRVKSIAQELMRRIEAEEAEARAAGGGGA